MKKKIAFIPIILVLLCLVAGGGYWYKDNYFVSKVFDEKTIELGAGEISETLYDYLSGSEKALENATVDISGVNPDIVGDYQVLCTAKNKKYYFDIHIVDTTAPTIKVRKIVRCFKTNSEFGVEDFCESVIDASNDVKVFFSVDSVDSDTISFDSEGVHSFTISASDPSGNISTIDLEVEFADGPKFLVLSDKYITVGSEYDLSQYVFAYDEKDGNLTDCIQIDAGGYDCNTAGEYTVTYSVTNEKGVTEEQSIKVVVGDATDYNIDFSDEDLELLVKYGHFAYEPLEEENFNKALELAKPCGVCISSVDYIKKAQGSSGSGYIYKISPQYVYILSNQHVLNKFKNKDFEIMLYDKTIINIPISDMYMDINKDIGVVKIKTSNFSKEDLYKLKQVYIDRDYIYNINNNDKLFMLTNNWKQGSDLIIEGTIINKELLSAFDYYYYNPPRIQTSLPLKPGSSGSPLITYNGKLLGMHEGEAFKSNGIVSYTINTDIRLETIINFIDSIE